MTVKLMKQGEGAVLFLEGRIDTMTAPEAQEALLPMADEYENLTLDDSCVRMMIKTRTHLV